MVPLQRPVASVGPFNASGELRRALRNGTITLEMINPLIISGGGALFSLSHRSGDEQLSPRRFDEVSFDKGYSMRPQGKTFPLYAPRTT